MYAATKWVAGAAIGLTLVVTGRLAGQAPPAPQQPPAPIEGHGGPPPPGAPAAPAAPQAPRPGQQQPRPPGRFPAQQRTIDQAQVERGRGVYVASCGACHGVDARGGQLGGPNLLRSQLVLNDENGELIGPVVKNGRPGTLMVAQNLPEDDIQAIAAYLHFLQSQGSNQGGPPPGPPVELDILVGAPQAGQAFFGAQCSQCHSAAGDLKGIASRVTEPKALQNLWVSGGRAARRGPGAAAAPTAPVTATVTWPSGEKVSGRLVRHDDFLVTLVLEDGTMRTIRRTGDVPALAISDPLEGHQKLLGVLTDQNMHDVTAYLNTLK